MKRLFLTIFILFAACVPAFARVPAAAKERYLDLAKQLAETVDQTAYHAPTGLYASDVDTETGAPWHVMTTHHTGWYLHGLWMLYWETGDDKYLKWIERASAAMWSRLADPNTGLLYMTYDLDKDAPVGTLVSHRIQYQLAAYKQWDNYMKSLRSAAKYQIVTDTAGNRTVMNGVDARNPSNPAGMFSPDYFGCLDLRVPFAIGAIEKNPDYFNVITGDFNSHLISITKNPTGLWTGELRSLARGSIEEALARDRAAKYKKNDVAWRAGMFAPDSFWNGTVADDTYTGLILHDLTGIRELFDIVVSQTRLALKYCYDPEKHYFYQRVDQDTGKVTSNIPRWHTNWEWALTLYILHETTGDAEFLRTADENYRFLIKHIDDPGLYEEGQGRDWNGPQIALLALFRYHQTGDEKYLDDAMYVADYLANHRLVFRGGRVFVGTDRMMSLREVGDFIAMFLCLADDSHPVISSRYFLFPVGIRAPTLPVFEDAFVSRFHTGPDGIIHASVTGGAGKTEDIWVMDLSGEIAAVRLNGKTASFETKKIAGQRYVIIKSVPLGKVEIEIKNNKNE
jgi:rhamnogalacturonyl hydrolase YesR